MICYDFCPLAGFLSDAVCVLAALGKILTNLLQITKICFYKSIRFVLICLGFVTIFARLRASFLTLYVSSLRSEKS